MGTFPAKQSNAKRDPYQLNYNSCTNKELRTFIKACKLDCDDNTRTTRRVLVELLEQADAERTFCFFELPGE